MTDYTSLSPATDVSHTSLSQGEPETPLAAHQSARSGALGDIGPGRPGLEIPQGGLPEEGLVELCLSMQLLETSILLLHERHSPLCSAFNSPPLFTARYANEVSDEPPHSSSGGEEGV